MKHAVWGAMVMAMLASVAHADPDPDQERVNTLKVEEPFLGLVQAAKPQAPTWCKNVKEPKEYGNSWGALARSIEASDKDFLQIMRSAVTVCQWPQEKAAAHASQVILQKWMNATGETQAQAVESLTARVDQDKFKADQQKVCNALAVSDEVNGEEKAYAEATRELMGCGGNGWPMWLENGASRFDVVAFLEQAETPANELVRIAHVLQSQRYIFNSNDKHALDLWIITYITTAPDLKALSDDGLSKALSAPPFAGNAAARAIGLESEAMARLAAAAVQREVDARTAKDADWKTLLVTAPEAATKAYEAEASKYKDQIARSNAFEHKFWGPSKKAWRGCWDELKKDFLSVLKDHKHATEQEMKESLNSPVLSLLWSRLVACSAVDKDAAYFGKLHALASDVRPARGPRSAAYYGAVEAYGQIKADREKFPVDKDQMRYLNKTGTALIDAAYHLDHEKSKWDTMGWVGDAGEGAIATVKKGADGVEVTFVKTKQQFMGRSCTPTNRIIQWRTDGSPVYYENCHDTGLYFANTTPASIILPDPDFAEGIKPGQNMKYEATRKAKTFAYGVPVTVYSDKSKKKLVMWNGLAMP